jgi:hypothetical protein
LKPLPYRLLPAAVAACLVFHAGTAVRGADAPAKPSESWVGIYLSGKKMGYTSVRTEPAEFRGAPGLKITSNSTTNLELFGKAVKQETSTVTYADKKRKPIYQEYRIHSNGSVMTMKADYKPDRIVVAMTSGGSTSNKEVPIPAGVEILADSSDYSNGKSLKPGDKAVYHILNPLTLSLDKTEVEVEAPAEVRANGKTVRAFRVVANSAFGKVVSYETASGEMLRGEMSFGPVALLMFVEPKERALDMKSAIPAFEVTGTVPSNYVPPSDFAVATAVTTDRPIKDARKLESLRLEIAGIADSKLILSDGRQRVSAGSAPGVWNFEMRARSFDAAQSVALPIQDPARKAEMEDAPLLEASDPLIRKTAAEIKGAETNAYRVASKIRAWVFASMKPDYTIGVPRGSTEIFKRRRGVCRDYATLFTGLARAAGIPTRVASGIVYMDGKFFYHAWAECWVGEWIPFDATLDTDFVDATHIKFAQGDATDMYRASSVIGRLKAKVLD